MSSIQPRALLTDLTDLDRAGTAPTSPYLGPTGVQRGIAAIEAQAVENERRRLYEAVEGWHNATKERGPVEEGERRAFRAVLALLAPPAEKEQT